MRLIQNSVSGYKHYLSPVAPGTHNKNATGAIITFKHPAAREVARAFAEK
jgi:hypothetical protein